MQKPFTCPIGMPCIRKSCYNCENIGRGGQEKGFHISVTKRLHDCWEKVCNAASGDNALAVVSESASKRGSAFFVVRENLTSNHNHQDPHLDV